MVFASLIFLCIFLPLNIILYFLWKNQAYRNVLLTAFSLVFYAWGEPVWIILLLFSATLDYVNARIMDRQKDKGRKRIFLLISVVLNLALLVIFKYSGFIYENINAVTGWHLKSPGFSLPIGISFYTFQTISYVIDVYRGEVPAQKSWLKFILFVSLYHQLVAGPIVRYVHIANDIDNRRITISDIGNGMHRFCIGLFKKVFIANVAGEFVLQYMDVSVGSLTTGGAWFGLLMYSAQIYFDFSGYSDMAIGMGWMFGFHYHENFNYPYIAKSVTDFWRRWHISLSTFFRDYIYIPLGGRHKRQYLNLFIVWFLTGMWHGASWNFIIWGLYFGVLIFLERIFLHKVLQKLPAFVGHLYLLFAAVLSWAIFYFDNTPRLWDFIRVLFGSIRRPAWDLQLKLTLQENILWIGFAILAAIPIYKWFEKLVLRLNGQNGQTGYLLRIAVSFALLFVSAAMLVGKSYNPFIYFRF